MSRDEFGAAILGAVVSAVLGACMIAVIYSDHRKQLMLMQSEIDEVRLDVTATGFASYAIDQSDGEVKFTVDRDKLWEASKSLELQRFMEDSCGLSGMFVRVRHMLHDSDVGFDNRRHYILDREIERMAESSEAGE